MTYQPFRPVDFDGQVGSLLNRLQKDVEERGWQFFVDPPPEVIPEFLQGYRPDALGIGTDGGVVIEIKPRRHEAQLQSLANVAALVAEQEGWGLRIFYVPPSLSAELDVPAPTVSELTSGIAEVRTLLESGHERAALVIAWSFLEAAARLVSPPEQRSGKPLSPIQAVQTLAEMGYLEEVDARRLRALTKLRNAVVHGSLKMAVQASDVVPLIQDLERIMSNLDEVAEA